MYRKRGICVIRVETWSKREKEIISKRVTCGAHLSESVWTGTVVQQFSLEVIKLSSDLHLY